MINKEFVNYTQALALDELGYDGESFATIDQTEYIQFNVINGNNDHLTKVYNTISCPLYQQVFRWFRNTHNLHIEITLFNDSKFIVDFLEFNKPTTDRVELLELDELLGIEYDTYEEAQLSSFRKLMDIIKTNKNK